MAQQRQAAAATPGPPGHEPSRRSKHQSARPPAPMLRRTVDGPALLRAVRSAVANLEAHVDEVDALNVFPVPDGDTGSNMLATMRAALAEAERLPATRRDLPSVAEALSRGALTGARGNSGVILSQIIRGMTYGADGRRRADGLQLAQGLRKGSDVAYGAVLSPVEGTILTVIRDAAAAAESAAGRRPHVEAVLTQVIAAAADSVRRTPQLLSILEEAGVVDSGGQGLYRLFEGMVHVDGVGRPMSLEGPHRDEADIAANGTRRVAAQAASAHGHEHAAADHGHAATGHGYETEYLVVAGERAIDVEALRAAITAIGDSVVVAGDGSLVRVHVHGEHPDQAIAIGLACGRLADVSVRDLDDQVAHTSAPRATPAPAPLPVRAASGGIGRAPLQDVAPAISIVAATRADGLARVLESLGARVVRPAHGTRPSVGEISQAILATGSSRVIVLPNDRDAFLAARHAADVVLPVEVAIVPSRNAAEGIAAAVAYDPDATFAESVARMQADAQGLRSFTVIRAARDASVDGVSIAKGQLIALDAERRLLAQGAQLEAVMLAALERLGDFELVSCYHGEHVDDLSAALLREAIEAQGWAVDVEMVPGGQRHDLLLVAVE